MHPEPDRLIRVPIFAKLTDEERERVASWLDVEEHKPGTRLAHEGTTEYGFFVLDQGEARVDHDGHAVGRLGPGDVFGELAMLGDGHRRADVVAVTEVRVFAMFGTRFREMQMSMPAVAPALQDLAEGRLIGLDAPGPDDGDANLT